jgi:hypothetical protein
VLNHTIVICSFLGTYIQSHKTSAASEAFNVVGDKVIKKSKDAITLLKEDGIESKADIVNEDLNKRFIELNKFEPKN